MGHNSYGSNEKYEKKLIKEGTHLAICYSFIDLGTHVEESFGKIEPIHKIQIGWELPNLVEKYTPKDTEEEKDFIPYIFKEYTDSLNEKSNLHKDLVSWRGKQFTEEELNGFDIEKVVGVPCLLTIVHVTAKTSGNEYEKITSVSKIVEGMPVPELSRSMRFLSFQDEPYNENLYNSLPEWLQNKIATSNEYKRMNTEEVVVSETTYNESTKPIDNGEPDDDVPF